MATKRFDADQDGMFRAALAFAAEGGQALYTFLAPASSFRMDQDPEEPPDLTLVGYLFDQDATRLVETAIKVNGSKTVQCPGRPWQHVRLIGAPLDRAIAAVVDTTVVEVPSDAPDRDGWFRGAAYYKRRMQEASGEYVNARIGDAERALTLCGKDGLDIEYLRGAMAQQAESAVVLGHIAALAMSGRDGEDHVRPDLITLSAARRWADITERAVYEAHRRGAPAPHGIEAAMAVVRLAVTRWGRTAIGRKRRDDRGANA